MESLLERRGKRKRTSSAEPVEETVVAVDPPLLENDRVFLENIHGRCGSAELVACVQRRASPEMLTVCEKWSCSALEAHANDSMPALALTSDNAPSHDTTAEMPSSSSGPLSQLESECPGKGGVLASPPQEDAPVISELTDRGCEEAGTPKAGAPKAGPPKTGKPVEIRVAGSGAPWQRFAALRHAHDFTGIPTDLIKSLCETGGEHLGWQLRWPPAENAQIKEKCVEPCDIGSLGRRIRLVPSAARRRLLCALPEETRTALAQHMRTHDSPRVADSSRASLNEVMSVLPEVIPRLPQDARCKVLAGVRDLGARHRALLLAPDIATVASIIREVQPQHRRALLEALPDETQEALQKYMLAEKAAASSTPKQQKPAVPNSS